MSVRIHLHIDALALRGFPPAQQQAIAAALVVEVERQLGMPGTAAALGGPREIDKLRAALPAAPVSDPVQAGTAAGAALARSLRP